MFGSCKIQSYLFTLFSSILVRSRHFISFIVRFMPDPAIFNSSFSLIHVKPFIFISFILRFMPDPASFIFPLTFPFIKYPTIFIFISFFFENGESENSKDAAQLHLSEASPGAGRTDSRDSSRPLTVMAGGRRGVLRPLTMARSRRLRGYKTESEWRATRVAIVFLGVLFQHRRLTATHCSPDVSAIR